jgi:hypothetical protein
MPIDLLYNTIGTYPFTCDMTSQPANFNRYRTEHRHKRVKTTLEDNDESLTSMLSCWKNSYEVGLYQEDGGVCLAKMSTTVKRLEDEKRTRLRATAKKKTIKDYMKIADWGEVGGVEDVRNES